MVHLREGLAVGDDRPKLCRCSIRSPQQIRRNDVFLPSRHAEEAKKNCRPCPGLQVSLNRFSSYLNRSYWYSIPSFGPEVLPPRRQKQIRTISLYVLRKRGVSPHSRRGRFPKSPSPVFETEIERKEHSQKNRGSLLADDSKRVRPGSSSGMLSFPHTCLSSPPVYRLGGSADNISPALRVAEAAHLNHVLPLLPLFCPLQGHGGVLSSRVVLSGRNGLRMRKPP
ncbi:hypothetical protein AVEN_97250-2 [Araneus ventricosus]|uniref:Uncharacterized protein n=1 Tax=Araneus ventricosus TaxID=182803 RepID=A0A4Y2JCN2_ARAVE|nr:hypothetical protein AVEN_97250-2 [Araneus ventricosus]